MMIEVAREERLDMGLDSCDPLDPYELARLHLVPVYPIDELGATPLARAAVERLTTTGKHLWSAALIPVGTARIIIENTAHSRERRVSSLAHEMAHHLLEHPFDEALLNAEMKCRNFDKMKESQAKFLSGELLFPQKAARRAAFDDLSNEVLAAHFGVSTHFVQMQMSGARRFAENARAKQAKAGKLVR
jgi:hypothetical protein